MTTIDPKKLQELREKLKATEIDDTHITEHALEAAKTLCMAPAHRKVNLNALIGLSAIAQALFILSDFGEEESQVIDAEIEKAAARIMQGWDKSTRAEPPSYKRDARGVFVVPDEPDPESGVLLVFGTRIPKNLH